MNYKFYFFDFDYTLVNSEEGIVGCFLKTMSDMNYPQNPWNEIKNTIGMPIKEAISLLTGETNPIKVQEFLRIYKTHAEYYMTSHTHFFPDTIATLERIKASDAKIAIISTKTRHRIGEKFEQDGYSHLIDLIIGSEDTVTSKPNPEGINMALEKLHADKAETIYVGDSIYDAGAAQNAGIDFAAVVTGNTLASEFSAYPAVQIVQQLSDLK